MRYIDFHTHIFPDRIAEEALQRLSEHSGQYRPRTDATLGGLLRSMDRAGVRLSVVASIATRPSQMIPIFQFACNIRSDRVYPLVSFHPENPLQEVETLLQAAIKEGIHGVKLHPMYQGFYIDEKRMYPFYEIVNSMGMFLMFHSGFDIAFPGNRQADVERVKKVAMDFPQMTIISTHMGGWHQWDRLGLLSRCENVYIETSMTVTETGRETFRRLLLQFPVDRVLFGTDSPWTDQREQIEEILAIDIPDEYKERILFRNAEEFLKRFMEGVSS